MKILCIDGHNLMHRARSGFTAGDYSIVYNFMRQLRALIEKFEPTRVYFVLEGHPLRQMELDRDYKANRLVEEHTKEHVALVEFHRQKDIIIDLLLRHVPVSVVRHPRFEADDTIYNLVRKSSSAVPWVVVSSDTDFIQLLQEFDNVELYNPVKKTTVEAPPYHYVVWKALRGDASDNIKGVPGIGDKRATKLVTEDLDQLEVLKKDPDKGEIFLRNLKMIGFHAMDDEELDSMESNEPAHDWDGLAQRFEEMGFKSMLKEKYWVRFRETFDALVPDA